MIEVLHENLVLVVIALLVGIAVLYLVFRPRQRVRLTDSAPLRPHMPAKRDSRAEANDIGSEVAAAASDVTGELIGAPVHRYLSGEGEAADDFARLKGIGPKLSEMLHERGFTRFEQLAQLTPEEVDIIDQQLGAFSGRIRRDRVVDQAVFLARGDVDGFEEHFGKL